MTCTWEHHKKKKKEADRCANGHELKCGPFYHMVCPECDASLRRRCGICGSEVYKCCC